MTIKREALDYALEYLKLSDASSWTPTDFFEKVVPQFENYLKDETSSHGFKPNRIFYINDNGRSSDEMEDFMEEFVDEVQDSRDSDKYINWVFQTKGESRIEIL
jgi:hypothetical protein